MITGVLFGFYVGSFKFWKIWWWIAYCKLAFTLLITSIIYIAVEKGVHYANGIEDEWKRKYVKNIIQWFGLATFILFLLALPNKYFTLKGEFQGSIPFYYEPD